MRGGIVKVGAGLLLGALLCGGGVSAEPARQETGPPAGPTGSAVVLQGAELLSAPGGEFAGVVARGVPVAVLETAGEWVRVRLEGWIRADQVGDPAAAAGQGAVLSAGFRGVPWGATREEVRRREGVPVEATEDALAYRDELLGREVTAVYFFTSGILTSGGYLLTEDYSNPNAYLDAYDAFKAALQERYGRPKWDRTVWSDDLYRDDPTRWGFAVSIGHMSRLAEWETPDTRIVLTLKGNNLRVDLGLLYYSLRHRSLEEQERQEELGAKL